MDKPVSYTNRKGKTYYLHAIVRKSGKTGYAMKTTPDGALTIIPDDYLISEGVNGEVSVGRPVPRMVTELEEALVASKLKKLGLNRYRINVKGPYITIFEPDRKEEDFRELFGKFPLSCCTDRFEHFVNETLDKSYVSPVMRFEVVDKTKREFTVDRMSYRGDGGWLSLHEWRPLAVLLDTYLKHLGKESFFELI